MDVTACPNCGGKVQSVSIGWKCKKCNGFIDMQGNFHKHVEEPFLPPVTNADHIRAMSNKELASLLCREGWRMDETQECLEWLEKPADKTADFKKEFNCFEELKSSLEEAVNIKKLLDTLKQAKKCIEILEHQRDAAVKYIEERMVQDVIEGNEPCEVCAKASTTPCDGCDPKWCGREK